MVPVLERLLTPTTESKNEVLPGTASGTSIVLVLRLPFHADSLVAVLAGRPMPPRDLRAAELEPADGLGPSLTLVGADGRQRVWLNLDTGEVQQLQVDGGRFPVTITFRTDGEAPAGFDLWSEAD